MGNVLHWRDFGIEWQVFLNRHGIGCLHQTGAPERWKTTEASRTRVLDEAFTIIERSGAVSFIYLTISEDYTSFVSDRKAEGMRTPDGFVFTSLGFVSSVIDWCEENHMPMPEFVFESIGRKPEDALRKAMVHFGLREPLFRPKLAIDDSRCIVALQAADFLAYEMLRGWKDKINVGRLTRPYLQKFERMGHRWSFIDRAKMDGLIPLQDAVERIERASRGEA